MRPKALAERKYVEPLALIGLRGTTLAVKFATNIFVAKFLGLSDLGVYGLVAATAIAAPPIIGLGLAQTIIRRAVTRSNEEMVRPILFYAIYFTTVNLLLTSAFAVSGYGGFDTLDVYMVGAIILFEHANNLHFVRAALWAIIFMGVAFLLPEMRNIETLLLSWLLGSMIAFLAFVWTVRNWPWQNALSHLDGFFDWLFAEAREAFALYVSSFSIAVSQQADKYLVTLFLGLELTGVYIFFAQIYTAINNLIYVSVLQPARPRLVKQFQRTRAGFAHQLRRSVATAALGALGLAAGAVILVFMLLPHLDNPLLIAWGPILAFVPLASLLQSGTETLRLGFYAQHKDTLDRNITLVMLALVIVLYAALLWLAGLWGAMIALILALTGRAVLQIMMLWPVLTVRSDPA